MVSEITNSDKEAAAYIEDQVSKPVVAYIAGAATAKRLERKDRKSVVTRSTPDKSRVML